MGIVLRVSAALACICTVGCEDPFAYAESWEHNTCSSEIPSDPDDAMGVALDLIRGYGYSVVSTDGPTRTVMPLDRVEFGPDVEAFESWHELVHVRQDKSDGATTGHRAGVDEWRMAYEAQGARQDIMTVRGFGRGVSKALTDEWLLNWCLPDHLEWCREIVAEAIEVTDEECLSFVAG